MKSLHLVLLSLALASTVHDASADEVRQLNFNWPTASTSTSCELYDSDYLLNKSAPYYAGRVAKQYIGLACVVQIPRLEFDARYRFCAISYVESYGTGHHVCAVEHFASYVSFTYSYAPQSRAAPMCAFACLAK